MRSTWTLLRWQLRQLWWINLTALFASGIYVLFEPELLEFSGVGIETWFILAHTLLLAVGLSRARSPVFQYIYAQGFSRDRLWSHMMLTSLVSVLIVWIPVYVMIRFGIRSDLQDALLNYRFPIFSGQESVFPWEVLVMYLFLVPIFHYAWIRMAVPVQGQINGVALALVVVVTLLSISNGTRMPYIPGWVQLLCAGGYLFTAIALLVCGHKLHQQLEGPHS